MDTYIAIGILVLECELWKDGSKDGETVRK